MTTPVPWPGSGWEEAIAPPDVWTFDGLPRRCRRIVRGVRCDDPAVASLARPHGQRGRRRWWPYCREHMHSYGYWIDSGRIWYWRRIETASTNEEQASELP